MEDGVLLAPAPYSAPAAYYFPMMARISGVEVFKGPAAIRYGPNTIGGAINLQTRPMPENYTGFTDLSGGQENTFRAHVYGGGGFRFFTFLLEGVHLQTGGFKELDGDGTDGTTGFTKSEALMRTRFQTDLKAINYHQFDIRFGYGLEKSNETYLGLTDQDFAGNPYRRYRASALGLMQWNRMQIRVDYLFAHRKLVDFKFTAYRHDLSRDWRKLNGFRDARSLESILKNPAGQSAVFYDILKGKEDTTNNLQNLLIGTNARSFVSQGAQLLGHLWLSTGIVEHEIEVGLRYHNDHINRDHTSQDYAMKGGSLLRTSSAIETTTKNRGLTHALAGYLHDQLTIWNILIAPGIRIEHVRTEFTNYMTNASQNNHNTAILPGIGIHYQPLNWLALLAGVHKGFSPVAPGQTKEIKPEQSVNYEGGGRISYKKSKLELIGYYSDYSNLTGECTFSAGCSEAELNRQFNAGRVHVYGLEASIEQKIFLPLGVEFLLKALYTLTLSRFQTNFTSSNPQFGSVQAGDELPYVPKHQGTLLSRFVWQKLSFDISASYFGEMRNVTGQGEITKADLIEDYIVMDLAVAFEPIANGYAYITVKNLLNSTYMISKRPFGARPGRPLQITGGFKYLFEST